mmetsp:Transcript_12435/g.23689  ORF Transcript_12435/g.23689 Transcript_12435/m.23689 type:complete len:249 (+) Transcript_12435:88-834(+)
MQRLPEARALQPNSVCLGANDRFPTKLYVMLECAEQAGLSHVVTWIPRGRAFKILKPDVFMSHIANFFFKATKLTSIHRQLHLWGFKRVTYGSGMDAWYHTSFVKGRPEDAKKMVRTKIKKKSLSNSNAKPKLDVSNFFQSKSLQHDTCVSILDDEFERMVAGNRNGQNHNYPVISTMKQYSDTSTLQAPIIRHNQYWRAQVSTTFTKQACKAAEPLPFRIDNDMDHCSCNVDEFSQFINQMIQDPGE